MHRKNRREALSGIKAWPQQDRPREKLFRCGEHSLTDIELLAILLRSGSRGKSAVDLARDVYKAFGSFGKMSHTNNKQWDQLKGLGPAKLAQIKSALEIGRRFAEEKTKDKNFKIGSSRDAAAILAPRMRNLKKEIFKLMLLDSQGKIIEIIEVEQGTVGWACPIIREVFEAALQHFAASVICFHNHPAGDPHPSPEDKEFTLRLIEAGKIMQIAVLDHIIIGESKYFSFVDEGLV